MTTDLVLLPGLLCTGELFAPQQAALEGQARMWVPDHTKTDRLEALAAQILADAPPRFAVAGLSMGGYIAFEIMRQAPDRVTKLALIDTNARADRPEQASQRRDLVRLAFENGLDAVNDKLLPLLIHPDRLGDVPLVDTVRRMARETGAAAFARQQEAIIHRPDNRPYLAEISCPTVIIVGADDLITPVKVAAEMHAGIAGSSLKVVPACGHLSTLERPAAVNEILSDWLKHSS